MADLRSLAGLHEHDHELHACCLRCDRWCVLPLEHRVTEGRRSSRLPIWATRRVCGEAVQIQVPLPLPSHPRAIGSIEPTARQAAVQRPLVLHLAFRDALHQVALDLLQQDKSGQERQSE
jgi:hypothetical protein